MGERIIINSSDIANFYGCNIRTAQKKLKKVKEALNKEAGVTFKEYSDYYRLPVEEVMSSVK